MVGRIARSSVYKLGREALNRDLGLFHVIKVANNNNL